MREVSRKEVKCFSVDSKAFFTNGMLASAEYAQACCDEIQNTAAVDTELHYNDSTSSEDITYMATKIIGGSIGFACALMAEKKTDKQKMTAAAVASLSAGAIVWGLKDYSDIQKRKQVLANNLAKKVISYLRKNPLSHVSLVFHSQGADIGQRALLQLLDFKDRIHVITIGGMITIPNGFAKRVVNFQNGSDIISKVANAVFDIHSGERTRKVIENENPETFFGHGAIDHIRNPEIQQALTTLSSKNWYCLDHARQVIFPMH